MYQLLPSDSQNPVAKAVEAPLDHDVPCSRCGYNLRGLKESGRCPECRAPIRFGVRGRLLQYAPPEFLLKLKRGCQLTQLGIVIVVGAIVLTIVSFIAAIFVFGEDGPPNWFMWIFGVLWTVVPAASAGGVCAGWWFLTASDPHGELDARERQLRIFVRGAAIAVGVAWLGMYGPVVANFLMQLPPSAYLPLIGGLGILLALSMLALAFGSAYRIRDLAERLENDILKDRIIWQTAPAIIATGLAGLMTLAVIAGAPEAIASAIFAMILSTGATLVSHLLLLQTLKSEFQDLLD